MAELRGNQPALDHLRITRTTEPRLRGLVPAIASPIQSANQTLEKVALTVNRAGTHPGNPILAGLATRVVIPLASDDTLTGVFVFTDRADPKGNLVGLVSEGPKGLHMFDLPFVEGHVAVGSPATGAKRNYIRQQSRAGEFERTFWVQSKDFNVVQLNAFPALSPTDLSPIAIQVVQSNTVDPWIDVVADFMVGWADEFHVEHRSENKNLTPGFAKAYGGALTVSVFDTNPTPAQEGVGTEVNPFTEQLIGQTKKVQVENTVGLKRFTFRFRAKQGSGYFVDCPVEVNVTATACPPCDPPYEGNGGPEIYFPPDYIPPTIPPTIPVDIPESGLGPPQGDVPYSVEGIVPAVLDFALTEPILVFTIQAQVVGSSPKIIVRRWGFTVNEEAFDKVDLAFISQKEYDPLVVAGATMPTQGGPYPAAKAFRIAFSVAIEISAGVVLYDMALKDGALVSNWRPMFGVHLGQLSGFMAQGSGVVAAVVPS